MKLIDSIQAKISGLSVAVLYFFLSFAGQAFADEVVTNPSISGLENPLKISTLAEFIKKILDIVTTIGIPIIAIFIIYSGFLFVTARGDTGKLEKAKETFLWTIVGAAIVLASWVLAQAICETIVQLGNTTTLCR
jgi:predicted membrane protein